MGQRSWRGAEKIVKARGGVHCSKTVFAECGRAIGYRSSQGLTVCTKPTQDQTSVPAWNGESLTAPHLTEELWTAGSF